jgi:hypothetical protein
MIFEFFLQEKSEGSFMVIRKKEVDFFFWKNETKGELTLLPKKLFGI